MYSKNNALVKMNVYSGKVSRLNHNYKKYTKIILLKALPPFYHSIISKNK